MKLSALIYALLKVLDALLNAFLNGSSIRWVNFVSITRRCVKCNSKFLGGYNSLSKMIKKNTDNSIDSNNIELDYLKNTTENDSIFDSHIYSLYSNDTM